jgi:hypothetical protein
MSKVHNSLACFASSLRTTQTDKSFSSQWPNNQSTEYILSNILNKRLLTVSPQDFPAFRTASLQQQPFEKQAIASASAPRPNSPLVWVTFIIEPPFLCVMVGVDGG